MFFSITFMMPAVRRAAIPKGLVYASSINLGKYVSNIT